jgi:hypothetical protein
LEGGCIYYYVDERMDFKLNPSGALVEQSVSNVQDDNYYKRWSFMEFTFNERELYANVSYVDYVCFTTALNLVYDDGTQEYVQGLLSPSSLNTIFNKLQTQHDKDGASWDSLLVYAKDGSPLRALSCVNGIMLYPSLFSNYWIEYMDQVWAKYASQPLWIDTPKVVGERPAGLMRGEVQSDGRIYFYRHECGAFMGSFTKPGAKEVFDQDSGTFRGRDQIMLAIRAVFSTAINRSTLLFNDRQPHGEVTDTFYMSEPTNHYGRIVHEENYEGTGYTMPYDDICGNEEDNVSGFVRDSQPQKFTVIVGGSRGDHRRRSPNPIKDPHRPTTHLMQMPPQDIKHGKRKIMAQISDDELEKASHPKLLQEMAFDEPPPYSIKPSAYQRLLGKRLTASTLPSCFPIANEISNSFRPLSALACTKCSSWSASNSILSSRSLGAQSSCGS